MSVDILPDVCLCTCVCLVSFFLFFFFETGSKKAAEKPCLKNENKQKQTIGGPRAQPFKILLLYLCVIVCVCRAEDNFWELCTSTIWVLGIKLRSETGKHLYLLSHLVAPLLLAGLLNCGLLSQL